MKIVHGDIIILHMCTKNYDHMMYSSWDMVHNRRTDRQTDGKKWNIEVAVPPKKHCWSIYWQICSFLMIQGQWSLKLCTKEKEGRIVYHLEKCGPFSDFQHGFRSSQSTADLLTVVSDRIARAFHRSGTTRAVAIDISTASDRVWHAELLHKLMSYGISGHIIWPYFILSQ